MAVALCAGATTKATGGLARRSNDRQRRAPTNEDVAAAEGVEMAAAEMDAAEEDEGEAGMSADAVPCHTTI